MYSGIRLLTTAQTFTFFTGILRDQTMDENNIPYIYTSSMMINKITPSVNKQYLKSLYTTYLEATNQNFKKVPIVYDPKNDIMLF